MSYTALYRKWRPALFSEVRGQDPIVITLKNQVRTGRIGHAYLFCGSRGTGKTSLAKIFAKAINCEDPQDGEPCGKCAMCRAIEKGSSMNVFELDAASNNGVDRMREIIEEMQYPATEGRFRVYIIDEAHMLSAQAFNAFLKTLEEPPADVVFILATTEPHKILPTILSRCQKYDFKRISPEVIADRLREVCGHEGVSAEDAALAHIARKAEGGLRDAISLLDQAIAGARGKALAYDDVLQILGDVDDAALSGFLRDLAAGDIPALLSLIESIVSQGRDLDKFTQDFIWYLRNLLFLQSAEAGAPAVDVSRETLARLREEADVLSPASTMRLIRLYSALYNDMRQAAGKRVLFEVATIRAALPETEDDLGALTARVERLEQKLAGAAVTIPAPAAPVFSEIPEAAAPAASAADETPAPAPEKAPAPQEAPVSGIYAQIRGGWKQFVLETGGLHRAVLRHAAPQPDGEDGVLVAFEDTFQMDKAARIGSLEQLAGVLEQHFGRRIALRPALSGQTAQQTDTPGVPANPFVGITIETE